MNDWQKCRTKGWRMPPNTVKVDRTTPYGNPFRVGKHGTAAECVRMFELLMGGYLCLSSGDLEEQERVHAAVKRARAKMRGKNLACWCRAGQPCHADILLQVFNRPAVQHRESP